MTPKFEKGDVVYSEKIDRVMIATNVWSIDSVLCMVIHIPRLKKLDLPDYLDCWIPRNELVLISKHDFQ